MTNNYSEAKEEADRLSRVTRRNVEVTSINCDCDYSKRCGKCAGEGVYYELVYGFCDHAVKDDDRDEFECRESDCAEREGASFVDERAETFPRESAPLRSLSEAHSEGQEAA